MVESTTGSNIGDERLQSEIDALTASLCRVVDGNLDFKVQTGSDDPSIQKLEIVINFALKTMHEIVNKLQSQQDSTQRLVSEHKSLKERLDRAMCEFGKTATQEDIRD